jgi:hypothetical protein
MAPLSATGTARTVAPDGTDELTEIVVADAASSEGVRLT